MDYDGRRECSNVYSSSSSFFKSYLWIWAWLELVSICGVFVSLCWVERSNWNQNVSMVGHDITKSLKLTNELILFSLFEAMDSEGSGTIEMAALGRPFSLGMLYDCRNDSLVPGEEKTSPLKQTFLFARNETHRWKVINKLFKICCW